MQRLPEMPKISIWFVLFLLIVFFVEIGINIHQDNVIQQQRTLIKKMFQDCPDAWLKYHDRR